MNFKETKFYNQIKNSETNKILPLAYHLDSGIKVSDNNKDYIISERVKNLEEKYKSISSKSKLPEMNIKDMVTKEVEKYLGQNLPYLKFIYVNKENIEFAISETESLEGFIEWCVE